ncbi:peptidyl-tRNA hydrolase [Corynebacterium pyruviciproducens ATCC BAA-1742]|uniref:Peptidyl-tRNA hydrolase n=1 Tax=Corynebacterium pyruviciproducens ATCC BAA-1742 TaxID=1125779 RepID=S2Z2H2_9CORY|nr:aminoacyl-tRNA hydrolase [Corynebacterium pyruviciproducens]EPD70973.1 peptidyl-tRNA hydrolase [Corynebacterium pyruviciproducens ATCC BAA-1742]
MSTTYLVVGLGNPGSRYELTRHNIGFMAADDVAAELAPAYAGGTSWKVVSKLRASIAEENSGGAKVVIAKPQTMMNLSGEAVSLITRFFSIPPSHVIVLHDELERGFGTVELKTGGGFGGHNGLKSIAKHLGTPDFARVRIGIGRPPGRMKPADFVLQKFSAKQAEELPFLCSDATREVLSWIQAH